MAQYINLVQKVNSSTYNETYIKQNLPREFMFSLTASKWSSSAPYSQVVTVTGITINSTGVIGVSQAATQAQWQAANYAQLRITAQGPNTVTITAYGVKPTVDIPCVITCSSNMKLYRANGETSTDTVVGS